MITSSKVRTNKLWCSSCKVKLKKGELVYFELDENDDNSFENVYCEACAIEQGDDVENINDELHPFSGEAIGQY